MSAESRSVQGSPTYRLIKSRSESDLSQPESDEECYTLVNLKHTYTDKNTHTPLSHHISIFVFMICIPRVDIREVI